MFASVNPLAFTHCLRKVSRYREKATYIDRFLDVTYTTDSAAKRIRSFIHVLTLFLSLHLKSCFVMQ
jgi:hypothetical protein